MAVTIEELVANSRTVTSVTAAVTTTRLAAPNAGRRGLLVFNDSTAVLYLKYGSTASTSSFTVKILAGGYWEMPLPIDPGQIDGVWDAANGAARVTEQS